MSVMKRIYTIFAICCLVVFNSCNKDDDDNMKNVPECLRPIVEYTLQRSIQSPKANIQKYLYNNQEVYLINVQNFPDGQSFVYDLECKSICFLGGLDGPDNDCPNWDEAEFIETIWTDPR